MSSGRHHMRVVERYNIVFYLYIHFSGGGAVLVMELISTVYLVIGGVLLCVHSDSFIV